jgi:hypothetical protein
VTFFALSFLALAAHPSSFILYPLNFILLPFAFCLLAYSLLLVPCYDAALSWGLSLPGTDAAPAKAAVTRSWGVQWHSNGPEGSSA